jgi:hypothetical protein
VARDNRRNRLQSEDLPQARDVTANVVIGNCGATTSCPAAWRRRITAAQLDPSAQAPCTKTTPMPHTSRGPEPRGTRPPIVAAGRCQRGNRDDAHANTR